MNPKVEAAGKAISSIDQGLAVRAVIAPTTTDPMEASDQTSELVYLEPTTPNLRHPHHNALTKRQHPYALDCSSASQQVQAECRTRGYYCTSRGTVAATGEKYIYCTIHCECRQMYAGCIINRWDANLCLKEKTEDIVNSTGSEVIGQRVVKNNDTDVAVPALTKKGADTHLLVHALARRHSYALDCSSTTQFAQNECETRGYYCTSYGKVACTGDLYTNCNDNCTCRMMYASCIMDLGNSGLCLKETTEDIVSSTSGGGIGQSVVKGQESSDLAVQHPVTKAEVMPQQLEPCVVISGYLCFDVQSREVRELETDEVIGRQSSEGHVVLDNGAMVDLDSVKSG